MELRRKQEEAEKLKQAKELANKKEKMRLMKEQVTYNMFYKNGPSKASFVYFWTFPSKSTVLKQNKGKIEKFNFAAIEHRTLIDRISSWPNAFRSILTENVKFLLTEGVIYWQKFGQS